MPVYLLIMADIDLCKTVDFCQCFNVNVRDCDTTRYYKYGKIPMFMLRQITYEYRNVYDNSYYNIDLDAICANIIDCFSDDDVIVDTENDDTIIVIDFPFLWQTIMNKINSESLHSSVLEHYWSFFSIFYMSSLWFHCVIECDNDIINKLWAFFVLKEDVVSAFKMSQNNQSNIQYYNDFLELFHTFLVMRSELVITFNNENIDIQFFVCSFQTLSDYILAIEYSHFVTFIDYTDDSAMELINNLYPL